MRKIVGKGKKKAPPKTLEETSKGLNDRVGAIDGKAAGIDKKVREIKMQMNKMPKGSPAYKNAQRRALQLLKQKKLYDKQGDMARQQAFNVDMQKFNLESMQATVETVATMKETKKMMQTQMKKINIDKVMDLQDDVNEIMFDNEEIQDVLGENPMMDEVDDDELEAELDGIDEFDDTLIEETEQPDYLKDDQFSSELPSAPNSGLDKYGLPAAPVPVADPKQANAV